MRSSRSTGFRAAHLLVIGVVAAALGWGTSEFAVWQLERTAPEPKPAEARPEPPAFPEPAARPIEALDDDLIVAEPSTEPSTEPNDQPAAKAPAPAPNSAPPKASPKASRKAPEQRPEAAPEPSEPAGSAATEAHVFTLDRQRLKERFKEPEDVEGHGHLLPNVVDGERRGMKFAGVAPGGIFARLGIQTGDVVLSINDKQVTTHQKALSDLEKMREMSIFNVILERDGHIRRHRYVLK